MTKESRKTPLLNIFINDSYGTVLEVAEILQMEVAAIAKLLLFLKFRKFSPNMLTYTKPIEAHLIF